MTPTQKAEIARYLKTGSHADVAVAWPGNVVDREIRQDHALRSALISEVERRVAGRIPKALPPAMDLGRFARQRVGPMVCGLFSAPEQEAVLTLLEGSVVFLTPGNIAHVLGERSPWLGVTWNIANLYLGSLGAKLLGPKAPTIVGLSSDLVCYVSLAYFEERGGEGRFDDFVVHEAAHVLHDAKRGRLGLKQTRTRERLVELEFRKRETFAYACEAYRRIVELAPRPGERRALVEELAKEPLPREDYLDPGEYVDILREAAAARNGWKRILARCSPERERRIA